MSYCVTGLIRNVDEFGRIALPKKIRDILGVKQETELKEQDKIEFFIDRLTGCVVIKKVEEK